MDNAADDNNSGTTGPLRDSFDTFQYYWSSTERIAGQAWMVRMLDGRQLNGNKATVRNVRCTRR